MEGVQVRPLLAYVGMSAIAAFMVVDGLSVEPTRVVVAGPTPSTVSSDVSGDILAGFLLAPRAFVSPPLAGPVGPDSSGAPVLQVPAVAQGALAGGSVSPPAPAPAGGGSSTPTTSAPQPSTPGASTTSKGKGKGKKVSEARSNRTERKVVTQGKGQARGHGR